ncbi:MAG: tRNA-dihydrouridine synthase [Chloroflexi bacterium AL-W]|nr:tRNA-dihydrouridine synthase [Chloroflexi bacterium AL-N1]NOK68446.1 tRNA-dihydrouridine synthase [Chloroflexi bacterium AL-N10]NOK74092.1 tRNA-dihydrouridine synthase [Chloroflexi bacterium AL-N5]NOK83059.1 tRNA-dihydrouridine synthase [Chloroflexi bacterium AL-W]NOK90582.1 tRNA-dihydrouridine synthase [Chloroflexi bacterium AL-N15]
MVTIPWTKVIQSMTQNQYADLPNSYQIHKLTVTPNITLAPMAGVTDSIFRRIVLQIGGCGLVSSEMTNAASISPKAMKRHNLLDYSPEERPIVMQISGNDPDLVANAARIVEQLEPDAIDINCGCPSPKVTGGGHGSALLRDLPKMEQLLKAVLHAVEIPVTLKFRAGWDEDTLNYIETAKMAEQTGVAALALHPRTREQRYSGSANWGRIAETSAAVSIPVIGSGDVKDAHDALARLRESGAAGVMIGRGAMTNPWIFQQIEQLRRGEPVFEPAPADKYEFLLHYLMICETEMNERLALNKLKQLMGRFLVALPGCAALRESVHRSTTIEEAREHLAHFFEPYVEMTTVV